MENLNVIGNTELSDHDLESVAGGGFWLEAVAGYVFGEAVDWARANWRGGSDPQSRDSGQEGAGGHDDGN